jgi:hypothetical protein
MHRIFSHTFALKSGCKSTNIFETGKKKLVFAHNFFDFVQLQQRLNWRKCINVNV